MKKDKKNMRIYKRVLRVYYLPTHNTNNFPNKPL